MTNTFGAKGKLDYAAEGMAARDAGEPVTAAPYAQDSIAAISWALGWVRRDKQLTEEDPTQ